MRSHGERESERARERESERAKERKSERATEIAEESERERGGEKERTHRRSFVDRKTNTSFVSVCAKHTGSRSFNPIGTL